MRWNFFEGRAQPTPQKNSIGGLSNAVFLPLVYYQSTMSKFTILRLGQGSLEVGFSDVEARLSEDSQLIAQRSGALPANRKLSELLKRWQFLYDQFYQYRYYASLNTSSLETNNLDFNQLDYAALRGVMHEGIEIEETGITSFSQQEFQKVTLALKTAVKDWLDSPQMRDINNALRTKFSEQDEISLVIETTDPQLQRLPWHFWQFFEDYRHAEPLLSVTQFGQVQPAVRRDRHRILVILGNREGIDTTRDESILQQLDAEFEFLIEPSLITLTEYLRDPEGWDILFFAGHSSSQFGGKLFLNTVDEIKVDQVRNALQVAIAQGLQLAIFNSCDGQRIAHDLLALNLRTVIVMKEAVPNQIAQDFLKAFLSFFEAGQTLPTAVRLARETLEGYELEFPCASWLPAIWQHPAIAPMRWQEVDLAPGSQQDWGESIDVSTFYGRQQELDTLQNWIIRDRCRLVAIVGMGGIGKTTLVTKLAKQFPEDTFEFVIRRSLRNCPILEDLMDELVKFFSGQQNLPPSGSLDSKIAHLLGYLQQHRCLIILDDLESLLEPGKNAGQYCSGYQGYSDFIKRIGEIQHQSCLVITSREKTKEIAVLAGEHSPTRFYELKGLQFHEGKALFVEKGCFWRNEQELKEVVEHYAGNPLALNMVAADMQDIVGGNLSQLWQYIREEAFQFEDIDDLLTRQFNRLSPMEVEVIYWLAINRDMVSIETLQTDVMSSDSILLLRAVQSLRRRCLIEQDQDKLLLQPVILEYITQQFINEVCTEILTGEFNRLQTHALLKAQIKDYIREAQARLILKPILERVSAELGGKPQVEHHLKVMLAQLREQTPQKPGYTAGNLINLLRQLQSDLSDLDCSNLFIWQAYLVGANLHRVNFANTDLSKSVFTETINVITSISYSPNGEWLAIASVNGEIQIWQVMNDCELQKYVTFQGSTTWIWSICFSPDSQTLLSGSTDHLVKLWDVRTGNCLRTFEGHTSWAQSVCFSPDGAIAASCGSDCLIKLWDVESGACLQTLTGHTDSIWRVCFSPDGRCLASSGDDGTIQLWNVETGACQQVLVRHTGTVYTVVFSATGQLLISGGVDRVLKVWDIASGECLHTLHGHDNNIFAIARHPVKPIIASSGRDGMIKLWHVKKGICLKTLQGHHDRVLSVAFSPDGQILVSGSDDQTLRFWNTETGQCFKILRGYASGVRVVRFSPDGKTLLSGNEDKTVYQWDLSTHQYLRTFTGHGHWIAALDWNPDSQTFVSGSATKLRFWNTQTGECMKTLEHEQYIYAIAFNPNEDLFVSAGGEHILRVWHSQTLQCLNILQGHTNRIWSVAFSPNGQTLASASHDQTVRLWDIHTGEVLHILRGHRNIVFSVAFSPDGQQLASGGDDGTIRLWDVQMGTCQQVLQNHGSSLICSVEFSPDGKLLATGSDTKQVNVWDVETGQCIQQLTGHKDKIWSIAFHPDGSMLASGSQDGTIKLWDTQTYECMATLQTMKPYQDTDITGVKGLTKAQKSTLSDLGAIVCTD
jgi:WD40 repeat protein